MNMDLGEPAQDSTEAITVVLSQIRYEHAEARRIYDNHHNMNTAIKLW